jgi:hypothetical protein
MGVVKLRAVSLTDSDPPLHPLFTMPIQSRNNRSCLATVLQGTPIKAHAARDPELPQMYEVFDHPLRPKQRSIVFLADLTIEGQMKSLEVQNHQRIPGPGLENTKNSGACY